MTTKTVLALSGSLRKQSTNTMLLRAAAAVAPASLDVRLYDYRDLPHYDGDIAELPPSVVALKEAIDAADGVLIATPEYNYSVPGVLKNAIDWASRPAYGSPFRDKKTGVLSAAASFVGGARAQQHLKTILLGMGTPVFAWPELLVGSAHTKFEDGVLKDEKTGEFLVGFMEGFAAWLG